MTLSVDKHDVFPGYLMRPRCGQTGCAEPAVDRVEARALLCWYKEE